MIDREVGNRRGEGTARVEDWHFGVTDAPWRCHGKKGLSDGPVSRWFWIAARRKSGFMLKGWRGGRASGVSNPDAVSWGRQGRVRAAIPGSGGMRRRGRSSSPAPRPQGRDSLLAFDELATQRDCLLGVARVFDADQSPVRRPGRWWGRTRPSLCRAGRPGPRRGPRPLPGRRRGRCRGWGRRGQPVTSGRAKPRERGWAR